MILDGPHCRAIHQFESARARIAQWHDSCAGGMAVAKQQQSGVLHRQVGNRVEHGLGDEAQRTFRSDEQVAENVHGPLVIEERVQRIADGVLGEVLEADAFVQSRIRMNLGAQLEQALCKSGLTRAEDLNGGTIDSIDNCARR